MHIQSSSLIRTLIFALVLTCVFADTPIPEEKPAAFSVVPYHAIAMFVIWTFLVELPLLAIRKFKAPIVHLALFGLLDILTLGSVAFVAFQKWEKIQSWRFKTQQGMAHCVLGLIVPLLIVLQHILGFLTLNKSATARPVHKSMGVFLYYLTKLSVLTGAYMFEETLFYIAIGWFSLVLLVKIVFSGKSDDKTKSN